MDACLTARAVSALVAWAIFLIPVAPLESRAQAGDDPRSQTATSTRAQPETAARPGDSARFMKLNLAVFGVYHHLDRDVWTELRNQKGGGLAVDWEPAGFPVGFEFSYSATEDEKKYVVPCVIFGTCKQLAAAFIDQTTVGLRKTWDVGTSGRVGHHVYLGGGAAFVRAELDSTAARPGDVKHDTAVGGYVHGGYSVSVPALEGRSVVFFGVGVRYTEGTDVVLFGNKTSADGPQALFTIGWGWRWR